VSLIDKVIGRLKQAAGDVADDPGLRREGVLRDADADGTKDESRERPHPSGNPDNAGCRTAPPPAPHGTAPGARPATAARASSTEGTISISGAV
jgi:hypothetical protein